MGASRGSIAFFATYRPPLPLDIFVRPANPAAQSSSEKDEQPLSDGVSYNYNCRAIPPAPLKELLTFLGKKNPQLASQMSATPDDAAKGLVTGLVFVSERDNGLETLHVALCRDKMPLKVLRLADIYGDATFGGARMEDSGCFAGGFAAGGRTAGHSIVYVSTKEPVKARRTPWTVVYKTNLADGKTERLTPPDQYDLSPAVSPSGKMVAVANFQFHKWSGEIGHIKTDIVVMNVDKEAQGGLRRKIIIRNGGWPTWGSDNFIFFHRGIDSTVQLPNGGTRVNTNWGVYRYDMRTKETVRVTPDTFDAMTPAAISETKVAVATIRQSSLAAIVTQPRQPAQYRHIEVYDVGAPGQPVELTLNRMPKADHYNPFVLDGGSRIGYHRCRMDRLLSNGTVVPKTFDKLQTPDTHKDVGLFRVSGVFPSINKDGSKLAFVDNEFKAVWLADKQGLRVVYEAKDSNNVFAPSWIQNPDKDVLYICKTSKVVKGQPPAAAFNLMGELDIYSITDVSSTSRQRPPTPHRLTTGGFNNAFPSSSPDGTKLVFRSTCDRYGGARTDKNLCILNDAEEGEFGEGTVTRLTKGAWVDTHCSWSPSGDWIVFASSRNKDKATDRMPILDDGCFAVYLVSAKDVKDDGEVPPAVLVVQSSATFAGHINHPVFSSDMRSIVFTADLAAVSIEPVSMPVFLHSVRPYGDIFAVDLRDKDDITKNSDIQEYHRITHSRYEYSTPTWTNFATVDPNQQWSMVPTGNGGEFKPACPYMYSDGGEGWHMAGHLTIQRRCC